MAARRSSTVLTREPAAALGGQEGHDITGAGRQAGQGVPVAPGAPGGDAGAVGASGVGRLGPPGVGVGRGARGAERAIVGRKLGSGRRVEPAPDPARGLADRRGRELGLGRVKLRTRRRGVRFAGRGWARGRGGRRDRRRRFRIVVCVLRHSGLRGGGNGCEAAEATPDTYARQATLSGIHGREGAPERNNRPIALNRARMGNQRASR